MAKNSPESSVHDEQFSSPEKDAENTETPGLSDKKADASVKKKNKTDNAGTANSKKIATGKSRSGKEKKSLPKSKAGIEDKQNPDKETKAKDKKSVIRKPAKSKAETTKSTSSATKNKVGEKTGKTEADSNDLVPDKSIPDKKSQEGKISQTTAKGTRESEESKDIKHELATGDTSKPAKETEDKKTTATAKETEIEEKKDAIKPQAKDELIDFSALSKEDLVAVLKETIDTRNVLQIKNDIESIKTNFYKKHKTEIEKKRKIFLEEGGDIEDFKVEEEPLEKTLKEYLRKYKEIKSEYNKNIEEEKHDNLNKKYQIIEEIKVLVNRKESINKTFHEFRELQKKWRLIGLVPQQNVKDLWETYHHHVEAFYDYIKINKELRDLDLKKNLEVKIELCEKAEELLLEPNIIFAFNQLQKFHEQWREIGPVPADMRTDIWERFKETTSIINKKHQEYFLNLKKEQKKNLEAKNVLCEKAEELSNLSITNHKDWDNRSSEIIELQRIWKTIGFAPKKDNNKIYTRFRGACDEFFNKKREFYSLNREEQNNNLQLKTDLCVQAEALKDSNEWKKTTEELITLQKRWKEIGPVPYKYSERIWRRFRSACDKFFEKKESHFSEVDNSYEHNLKKKQELIDKVEKFELTGNIEECLKKLKEFQREWAEIGFVPYKYKDDIQEKYRASINSKFDNLNVDENYKNLLKFKTKLESLKNNPNGQQRINQEQDKFINKLKQLENDIVLWENNIGFFAKTKNAESMITEVEEKIKDAKKRISLLKEKLKLIDEFE